MESHRLSDLIRAAFEDALRHEAELAEELAREPALAGLHVRELPRLLHDRHVPLGRQDEILLAVIGCYRRTGSPGWSAVLLEMLAPALLRACLRMVHVPRGIETADVEQQMIAETLTAAMSMPLPESVRWVQRRLVRRAASITVRWLVSMARSQAESLAETAHGEASSTSDEDARFLIELMDLGVPAGSLALLYRSQVLGQTIPELAIELGASPAAIRTRQRRALYRLRHARPDLFGRLLDGIRRAA